MTRRTIFILTYTLIALIAHAQGGTIHGKVTDATTGEELFFASLLYKGTSIGTSTDTEGNYTLPAPETERTLQVSFLGFKPQEIAIHPHESRRLDIALQPLDYELQEVTVKPQKERYRKKDNPAVRFAKQLIERRGTDSPKNKDYYQYDQYEKVLIGLNEYQQKTKKNGEKSKFSFLNEYVDTLESGTTILPILEKEKAETVLYRKHPKQEKRIVRGQLSSGVDEILTQDGVQQFLDEIFKDMDIFQNDIPLYSRFQDFLLPHPLLLKNKSCPKNHSPDSSLYKENNKINRSI